MKKSIGAQTILFPTPVLVVGTYDSAGRPNAAAVAWGGICCSRPPCVAIALRAATYSHGNIMERKAFTVNLPSERYVREADYFGLVSGRKTKKFAATKLTPVKSAVVDAPYIEEFPFVLECQVKDIVEVGLHTQFIGEIKDIKVDDEVLDKEGTVDIRKVKPIMYNPADRTYCAAGKCLGEAFSLGENLGR